MKLLDRAKSYRNKHGKERPTIRDSIAQRPSTSSGVRKRRSSLPLRPDGTPLQAAIRAIRRPKTAEGENRVSFFEAFHIDAGEDLFHFPKTPSAKSPPVDFLAPLPSPGPGSPLIGIAFGSPTHPPPEWQKFLHASTRSATASPRTFAFQYSPLGAPSPLQHEHHVTSKAEKRKTWRNLFQIPKKPAKSYTMPVLPAEEAETKKSRRLTMRKSLLRPVSRSRRHADEAPLRSDIIVPEILTPLQAPRFPGSPHSTASAPVIASSPQVRKLSKVSRILGATDEDLLKLNRMLPPSPGKAITTDRAERPLPAIPRSELPTPRLDLRLPSFELERYSVMFEDVLDKPSSLLERRKSRLNMLDVPSSHRPMPLKDHAKLSPLPRLSPVPTPSSIKRPTRTMSSPGTSPTVARHDGNARAFHKPLHLQRANTIPAPRVSPLQTTFEQSAEPREVLSRQTFFESPVSPDDEEMSLPQTPPVMSHSALPDIHVVTDFPVPIEAHKDGLPGIWHTALPPVPGSSTSSRFSVDIHRALDSPSDTLSRSKSTNTTATRAIIHKVQVATARRISVSRARQAIQNASFTKQPVKPKLINVSTTLHSRKSSVLDTAADG